MKVVHICQTCQHRTPDAYCGHPTDAREFLADTDVTDCSDYSPQQWPTGCQDTGSCEKHRDCMYLGCRWQGRDVAAGIDAALADSEQPAEGPAT